MAVAIGQDADRDVLEQFIATDGAHPLRANSPESLVRQIRWASTAALQSASAPAGAADGDCGPAAAGRASTGAGFCANAPGAASTQNAAATAQRLPVIKK